MYKNSRFGRIAVISCVVIVGSVASAHSLTVGDVFKTVPLVVKTALGVGFIPEAFKDSSAIAPAAVLFGLLSVPNAVLLYNVYTQNPERTRMWRRVTVVADTIVAVAALTYGVVLVSGVTGGSWDGVIGGLAIAISIPIGGFAVLDLFPYSFEPEHQAAR